MIILILVATEINRDVEKLSQQWTNIAEKPISKEVKAFIDELNMNTDCCHSATKTFTRNPLTDESYEPKIHTESRISGNSSSDAAQKEQNKIIIFMSYSVPKPVWQKLRDEAKALNKPIQFVLRGLPSNSFQELAKKVLDYGCQISIDPPLFERYNITAVPAFLMKDSIYSSDKRDHNHIHTLDKEQKPGQETVCFGNVSLACVIEKGAKTTTKETAREKPPQLASTAIQSSKETGS